MFLMRADPSITRALEIETFLGPEMATSEARRDETTYSVLAGCIVETRCAEAFIYIDITVLARVARLTNTLVATLLQQREY